MERPAQPTRLALGVAFARDRHRVGEGGDHRVERRAGIVDFGAALKLGGADFLAARLARRLQLGRASCRASVCQYGVDLGGLRTINTKTITSISTPLDY